MAIDVEHLKRQILTDFANDTIDLPAIPELLFRIRQSLYDTDKSAEQQGRIVQLESSIATKLIQVANSAQYLSFSSVSDCKSAITLLGLETTRNIVTSLLLRKSYKTHRNPVINNMVKSAWQRSCHVGALSHLLGGFTAGMRSDRAMLAGMIHNIGVLPLINYFERFPDALEHSREVADITQQFQGKLGTLLLKHWKFDHDLIDVPEKSRNPAYNSGKPKVDLVDIVVVARMHVRLRDKTQQQLILQKLQKMPSYQKLSISKLGADASIQLIDEAEEDVKKLISILEK